ncbi:MAG: alpha-L-arabinofuranosidase, partial [Verrucomicrobiota bacterium]
MKYLLGRLAGLPVKPRRIAQIRVAIFLWAVLMLLVATNGNAAGTYVLNEKFNDMTTNVAPGGWTSVATSASVQIREYPFAADKSVRIEKTDTNSGESSILRTFPNQTGRVAFEAKVLTRGTDGFKALPYIYNSDDTSRTHAVISVAFEDGNIKSYVGATKTTIQPFVANDWYMIRVVINTTTNTYDLFIDGVRKLNNAAVRNNTTSLGQLKFFIDGVHTGILYVDNVKIWELGDFIGARPEPIFDVHAPPYNATGDGKTNDTVAIQAAIDACAGSGGTVYLSGARTYLTGTLYLKSNMTFFIESTANLKASTDGADFPKQDPPTTNNQLLNCRRAHLYAVNCTNLKIDGG